MTDIVTRTPLSNAEIMRAIEKRTTEELIAFRNKLKRIDSGQAWALRFYIIKELTRRYIAGTLHLPASNK